MKKLVFASTCLLASLSARADLFSLPEALTLEVQQVNLEAAVAAQKNEAKSGKPDAIKKAAEAETALKALKKEKSRVYKTVKSQGLCKMPEKDLSPMVERSREASVANMKAMQPKADDKKLNEQSTEAVRRFKVQKAELCPAV